MGVRRYRAKDVYPGPVNGRMFTEREFVSLFARHSNLKCFPGRMDERMWVVSSIGPCHGYRAITISIVARQTVLPGVCPEARQGGGGICRFSICLFVGNN